MVLKRIVAVVLLAAVFWRLQTPNSAYIDPALLESETEEIDVIITGDSMQAAQAAVASVDGVVSAELGLIDAVAATVPTAQLDKLARQPKLHAIVNDHTVVPATIFGWGDDPVAGETTPISDGNATLSMNGTLVAPVALPDGGLVLLNRTGSMVYLNADGSLRRKVQLFGFNYSFTPLVMADGTLIVVHRDWRISALNPDGTKRWTYEAWVRFNGNGVVSADQSTYYIADRDRNLIAIDIATGDQKFKRRISSRGSVDASLTMVNDVIYIPTDYGRLIAVDLEGNKLWEYVGDRGADLSQPLVNDEIIVATGRWGEIYGISAENGRELFSLRTRDYDATAAVLGNDGTTYIADEDLYLYAINPDGSLRYRFRAPDGDEFQLAPVLSRDHATVYAQSKDGDLFALDAQSGDVIWHLPLQGRVYYAPTLTASDDLLIASNAGLLYVVTPTGEIRNQYTLGGSPKAQAGIVGKEKIIVVVNDSVGAVNVPFTEPGSEPHVAPTNDPLVYNFAMPTSLDVGADQVHDTVRGAGVTVAVVDSGVYFDSYVQSILGDEVAAHYWGQADFVGFGICPQNQTGVTQQAGHCWREPLASNDPYGHGSHVAGIIWNQFRDLNTDVTVGIAPDANILSVRVLDETGRGRYTDVIAGIQYVVDHKDEFDVRVLNLSLSSQARTPYFADPLNRAVEAAWANGIVVVTAAGNGSGSAETISAPGNDPYIITVGAVASQRTADNWADDTLPEWSAAGPTLDGFAKPDVIAPGQNIVSFMYNDPNNVAQSAELVQAHPDYSESMSLFRMSGTSMSTAVTSGVIALMLEAHPDLTPDQVKYRLIASARMAVDATGTQPTFVPLKQGNGRVAAYDAVLGDIPLENANKGMDILNDLAHPWYPGDSTDPAHNPDLANHYRGPIQRVTSLDGLTRLYVTVSAETDDLIIVGAVDTLTGNWINLDTLLYRNPLFDALELQLLVWFGGLTVSSDGTGDEAQQWADGFVNGGAWAWSNGWLDDMPEPFADAWAWSNDGWGGVPLEADDITTQTWVP